MDSVHPAEATKAAFELVLLGSATLRDGHGQIPIGLGSGKPLALLCFLAIRGEVRREEALALLWGDVDEDRARNAFRQALHRLRLALGEDLVVGDRQKLRFVAGDRLRADVLAFEKAADESRLEEALALYRGDFLHGFEVGSAAFDEWAEGERRRLRSRCQSVAEQALQRALVDGRLDDAQLAARKLLAVAPLDARTVEVAAAGFVSMGKRAEAAEVLRQFSRSSDELGAPLPRALQIMLDRLTPEPSRRAVGEPSGDSIPVLVGRSSEVAQLLATWSSLDHDSGGTVVIEGPAGVGTSRLVREFADGVRALGPVHVLQAVEGPPGFTVPYAAMASALRPLVRAAGVAGASPHLLAEAARILPELRDTFQLPTVELGEEGDTARLRVCEGIAALIESAAFERPICLVLEDVHRATTPTVDLLGYLAARLRRAPVLLVLTFTSDLAPREMSLRLRALAGGVGALRGAGTAASEAYQLRLRPLSPAETRALVTQILGAKASVELVEKVSERAEGMPLRAVELARLALDGVEPTSLPVRMGDIVRHRLQACSPNERRLFLVAALVSRPVPLRVLAEASHVPAAAAQDAANALIRRGLLIEEGKAYGPSSNVAADASLDLAGEATTAFVAGWVAEVLAREPDAGPAELVRLFAQAGRTADTHRHAREAGERALARGAVEEAIYFLTIARAFARTNSEHASVESLLSAQGAGRLRLAGPEASSRATDSRLATVLAKHFPNWRYLAAAAAITSVTAIAVTAWGPAPGVNSLTSRDTLVVAKARESRRGLVHLVTSDPRSGGRLRVSDAVSRPASRPAWVDSMSLPWVNARPSPTGRFVAVERITPGGSRVFLIAADRRDTIPLGTGDVEAFGMGWSPDGESFLVTRRLDDAGQGHGVGLYAHSTTRGHAPIAIDTSASHAVVEAAWSPDGSRIGWVARIGGRQEEVFVAWADGSHRRNVSAHPAQDDHLAWSADGSLIAFTSRRDGNAELYAYDLLGERLWRLTQNEAQDDRATFSGDGRLVSFESTRGGASDVYVMPSLGGGERRVGDSTSHYEVVEWRRAAGVPRYIDRLELDLPPSARRGDTIIARVRAVDQSGVSISPSHARWSAVDTDLLTALPARTDLPLEQRFVVRRDGLARVEVTIGAWRSDTAYIRVGSGPLTMLREQFLGTGVSRSWRALGRPIPTIGALDDGRRALLINADRQWESGVLSSAPVPLQAGLAVEATLHAPFQVQAAATTASLALVASDPVTAIDAEAPTFLRLISMTWNAEARRFVYAAEREVFAEAIPDGRIAGTRLLSLLINADGTVSFFVDGALRWRSTLRVTRVDRAARAQLWLGGQDTGARVGFTNLTASLQSAPAERR